MSVVLTQIQQPYTSRNIASSMLFIFILIAIKQTPESEQKRPIQGFPFKISCNQIRIKFRLLKNFLATHRQKFEV